MSNDTKYFAKNSITGLYFDGSSFCDTEPTRQFDAPEIAFLKATWDNVESVPVAQRSEIAEINKQIEICRKDRVDAVNVLRSTIGNYTDDGVRCGDDVAWVRCLNGKLDRLYQNLRMAQYRASM
jgi:hypothetical protein